MNWITRTIGRVLLISVLLILSISFASAQDNANVRFVHVIPGATAVDIYVNGTLAIQDLAYGEATAYINVPAGTHTISTTPTGIATALWEQDITAQAGTSTLFVASSRTNLAYTPYTDKLAATPFGVTRLFLLHALADGPAVDVKLAQPVSLNGVEQPVNTPLALNMAYGTIFGDFDLPAQTYTINVMPTGTDVSQSILSDVPVALDSNTSQFVIVYGTPGEPQALVISTPTMMQAGNGLVRFANTIANTNYDIYVNETLIAPRLGLTNPTEHIGLPAGTHTVQLREAGSDVTVAENSITVNANAAQTILALAEASGVTVRSFSDNVAGVNATNAAASVINAIPDATVSVSLENGTPLAGGLAFGNSSPAALIAPATQRPNFDLTIGGQTGNIDIEPMTFYGGNYYNMIAVSGGVFAPPTLLIIPTTLNQTLASSPDTGQTIVLGSMAPPVNNPPSDSGPTGVIAQPTPVLTQAAPPPPQVVVSTPEPVQPALPGAEFTGQIFNLNPGVNLQLRQYPNTNALSLGLVPPGTTVEIVGREGPPVALVEGDPPPPEAATWVDPAEALEDEFDDLEPTATWLNINYNTPDGGLINAWVNALYVDPFDADGEAVRLADLPLYGSNIAGFAENTNITPPAPEEDRVTAIVVNLNPGVGLNIRRNPTTTSEVIGRLPNGTVTEFVGLLDDGSNDWVFVNYAPTEGGSISGWVSTQYIQYQYNGRDTDLDELDERDLLAYVDGERVGGISGNVDALSSAPTPDPTRDQYIAQVNLNPGANLQFRVTPDASSESLNLIPSGTRLVVSGRNADGTWLRTTFEGETGWIASQFVLISFNGEFIEVEDVPVVN